MVRRSRTSSKSFGEDEHESVKWMSSKMSWMRKMMMSSDQSVVSKARRGSQDHPHFEQQQNSSNINSLAGGVIRVCSNCSTTKTPLWRSGPQGPKSLCNACGIRQRKERCAMATSTSREERMPKEEHKHKTWASSSNEGFILPYKKRCKNIGNGVAPRNLHFDDTGLSLSKNSSAFHQVFPQDEKDAAILLMALSSDLIYG
ncbi:protein CYTOKININ-RESPONSIVE GATA TRANSCRIPTION FACTOR 1 [Canna indica]|uniref:Protein CYTOKININ-RESPONSIVE GATA TRANSCRIPTION FACTOR 1 n=1 Tax=Canna indica TaxID=4628 RepID=A0AAQ3K0U9_9LILI|nr:protein CYTOKININ-RESPONSIVE GATA TRANSCRIPTION FACTOR 1 [Canna indica]